MIVKRLLIVSIAVAVIVLLVLAGLAQLPQRRIPISSSIELISDNGNVTRLNAEIADTPEAHRQGLMNRSSLAADAGMLFVFNNDERRYFWMKDTLIPLDMIFIDDRLTIIDIHDNTTPLSEAEIASSGPCRYVLEVNGGLCSACGISLGDRVRLYFNSDVSTQPQDR